MTRTQKWMGPVGCFGQIENIKRQSLFMSSAYCKAVANAIQGGNGAIANLHAEDILSMCFAVPSDYKTITELGKLLSLFDEKLHVAEEQLARFIEQKKYFLFKMFI